MNETAGQEYDTIIKMSYGFFSNNPCTPEKIHGFISMVRPILDKCGISKENLYSELERRHTVSILDSSFILDDHGDHVEWFNPSTNAGLRRDMEWHLWSHYRDYLIIGKQWPANIVESIDRETSQVLSRLEDPARLGIWDRRGMVMGAVQSGKTANYTGLIAKAIDAGYKLIVVLAGIHDSLRSQTQSRINEEILGYDLDRVQQFQGQAGRMGVREMFSDHRIVQTLTNSNVKGDFSKTIASQAGIIPSPSGDPTIMVVKKHVSILRNLIDWSTSIIGQEDNTGRRIVTDIPLLVIDDECDYASVNTREVIKDENSIVLEDCNPTMTNQRIRELLCAFQKSAYVGYTATPFASIFIHHDTRHLVFGEDLFPRNFIISLPQPSNYIGPERVFGLYQNWVTGDEAQEPLPLLRTVSDYEDVVPDRHKKDWEVPSLPLSLKMAIKSFLLACTVRHIRRSLPSHNSMLIHVTRFTNVQRQIGELVEGELRRLVARIQNRNDGLSDFYELWEQDFILTTERLSTEFQYQLPEWQDVIENLYPVVRRIKVKMINGEATDALEYRNMDMSTRQRVSRGEEVPWEEKGEHIIAIGGDKLSRGLTLEGLSVSYYLRASRMYDTLMQMGRWFGYRDSYLDVCRIYTTEELMEWYRHIATASMELRHELEYMALIDKEPHEFGLKVLSHPGRLAITSAGKMRSAEKLSLSYAGRISATIVFDPSACTRNREAVASLIEKIGRPCDDLGGRGSPRFHWKGVSADLVVNFLKSYKTHDESIRIVDPSRMAEYIEMQLPLDELVNWHVVIVSVNNPMRTIHVGGLAVGCVTRTANEGPPDRISIGTLVSPGDEWIDMSDEEKNQIRNLWILKRREKGKPKPAPTAMPPGPLIREIRPEQRGLLLIYALCSTEKEKGRTYGRNEGEDFFGFAISFPASETARQMEYVVGSVYQEEED